VDITRGILWWFNIHLFQSTTMSKLGVELNITAGGIDNIDKVAEKVSSANTSLKQMKQELRNVTNELLATEPGSEKFVQLTQQAGKLKDQMKDVAESINANAGPAVESLGNNFGLLTGKLQNLDFEGAAESLKAIGGNISNIKFADFAKGIQSMGSALASVGKALLTNPIFLIAAAIAAAVVYAEELLSLVDGVTAADEQYLNQVKERAALSKQELDNVSNQENILKKMGLNEEQILKLKIQKSKVAISDLEAQIATQRAIAIQQIEAAKRNQDILKGIIQFITLPLQAILFTVDKIASIAGIDLNLRDQLNELTSSLLFDPEEIQAEAQKSIEESQKAIDTLKNQQAGYELAVDSIRKTAADKAAADREKENQQIAANNQKRIEQEQKTQDAIRQAREQRLNDEEALAEEIFQLGLSEQERELQAVRDTFFEKITLAEQFGLDATALRKEQAKREVEIAKKYAEEEVEVVKLTNAQKLANAADTAQQLLGVASSLSEAFGKDGKKQFELNKKFSIAQALISTFLGVNAALTAGGNPAKLATGAQFVEAGVVLATGLANVAKIARTKFEGGGSSGGGGGSLSAAGASGGGSTPSSGFGAFNASLINNRPPQMTPAYVLAGDVKSQGEARQKVEDRARL
jgi:hypothetical protein